MRAHTHYKSSIRKIKIKNRRRWRLFVEPSSNIIADTTNDRRSVSLAVLEYVVLVLVPYTPNYN